MRDDHLVGEGRLFEPDVMLPAQYFTLLRKRAPQGPEYLLIIAMLQDAIECFQKYRYTADENGRQLFEDAREWITSEDQAWPFSFENKPVDHAPIGTASQCLSSAVVAD